MKYNRPLYVTNFPIALWQTNPCGHPDRGTYVRFCVTTVWIALETSCQDALEEKNIGYSFKENINQALLSKAFEPIDWSQGVWQQIIQVQNTRKDYVHRFIALKEMFPDSHVADNAIEVIRKAIKDIYKRSGKTYPEWVEICEVKGWDKQSQFGMTTLSQAHFGSSFDDPNTKRVYIVINGEEKLTSVFLIIKMLQQQRHKGMDCRYPDYMDVMFTCLPWHLGSANP